MTATSKILIALAVLTLSFNALHCQDPIPLIDVEQPQGGWKYGNGPEFPGARGKLEVASESYRNQPVLALHGDFTEGGNYVQAAIALPDVPVDVLSFWVNAPAGSAAIPIRLIDATGQCHQLRLKLNDKGGWQRIVLPVEEFFRKMGTTAALDLASQYEKWSGANDGRWHQPGKLLVVLASRSLGTDVQVLLSDVTLQPGSPKIAVAKTIPLDEMLQLGELGWTFNLGREYRGARGGLDVVRDQPEPGKNAMQLHADFTAGGAYVGVRKSFSTLDVQSMNVIRMKLRSKTTKQFALRMVDGSGQTHQRKNLPFTPDGKWHDIEIVPTKIAGGEHWGGANDGKWHGSVKLIELMLNTRSNDANKPDLYIADIRADVVLEATATPATFTEDFESGKIDEANWKQQGDIRIERGSGKGKSKALVLRRTLDKLQTATAATSPAFAVSPGTWQVRYAEKSELHSPDNSYQGRVALEVLDRSNAVVETLPVGIGFGKHDWTETSKSVQIPRGAASARFRIDLQKTYGSFFIDDLSASRLKVQPIEQRIERISIAGDATGNLFFPEDHVRFRVTVDAVKPLTIEEQTLRYSVRDYWGAEQQSPGEIALAKQPRKQGHFPYTAEITLPTKELEQGKFYELHVAIPQTTGDPVTEYSGFAVLPLALTKQHAPEEVPFTIRNWDSRIPVYFRLADRLGLRMLGVWGGWSSNPPYKAKCPGIDICKDLNAKWITGTPASQVERHGFEKYSEESLRKGMQNFLEAYADKGMAKIAMGNEPHGTGKKVLENVRAYRAIYETVKAFDPKIHVMGTSVEPNEEYFRAGYHKYLDSYDFHIYEHYTKVRRQMQEYRALMKKYDAVKPLHSTELGLNSQGQTRLAVSREMIKKFVSFFAEGGATVSWFTIQYPDPKGKARGQFGDSHCMFDCKYNLYNPRLDAVTHYHLINAISVKKFVEEKHYVGGTQTYLFRDENDRCLQVLWLDGKRESVFLPLSTEGTIRAIHIDGTLADLRCADGGVTLTLSEDPILLLYDAKDAKLPGSLGKPRLALVEQPKSVRPGEATTFVVVGEGLDASSLRVLSPSRWKTTSKQVGQGRVEVQVRAPQTTTAREAKIRVQTLAEGAIVGEVQTSIDVVRTTR